MTTITSKSTDLGKNPLIARANLARFGIFNDIPPAISSLIIDIIDLLPDPDIKHFLPQLAAVQPGADLSRAPAQFLHWLLLDPVHGAVNLTRRDDVKESIRSVAANVLDPMAKGRPVGLLKTKNALFQAQVAQMKTWHDYEFGHSIAGMQPRVEWMVASAATDALAPYRPEQLVGAVRSCAVAWLSAQQEKHKGLPFFDLHLAIRDKLLELLLQPAVVSAAPAPHCNQFDQVGIGSRVQFDDADEGPQTGTVLGILNATDAPATAAILVDHSLDGATWNVPLTRLQALEPVAA